MIGTPITRIIPEERLSEEDTVLGRIRAGATIDHFETVRRHKDGSLIDVSLSVSPVITADGAIVGASKIARDITDRKRVEEALRRREPDMAKVEWAAAGTASTATRMSVFWMRFTREG